MITVGCATKKNRSCWLALDIRKSMMSQIGVNVHALAAVSILCET
jgi:hypothetical protein